MNFNIVLSTIFYVMIFIFPGIIFRKFYFRGSFTSQFSKGNLFERFTLTMFFSIISALLSVSVLILLRYLFDVRFLGSVSYKTIIDVFNDIKKEHLYEQFGITFDKEVYSFMGDFIDEANMKLKPFGWEIDYKNREVSIFRIKKQNREIL